MINFPNYRLPMWKFPSKFKVHLIVYNSLDLEKQISQLTTPAPTPAPVQLDDMMVFKSAPKYDGMESKKSAPKITKMKLRKGSIDNYEAPKTKTAVARTYYVQESQGKKKIITKQITVTLFVSKKTKVCTVFYSFFRQKCTSPTCANQRAPSGFQGMNYYRSSSYL